MSDTTDERRPNKGSYERLPFDADVSASSLPPKANRAAWCLGSTSDAEIRYRTMGGTHRPAAACVDATPPHPVSAQAKSAEPAAYVARESAQAWLKIDRYRINLTVDKMAKSSSKGHSEVRVGRRSRSIEIEAERTAVVNSLRPVVELLGSVLGPNIEIALHDLTQLERSVIYIVNGHITGRTIGSSALRGPKDDLSYAAVMKARSKRGQPGHEIIPDYPTENSAGVRLRSSTVIFRDADGFPFAALCVNADMTVFEMAHSWLDRVLNRKLVERPIPAEEPQLDELLSEIIDDSVSRLGKPVSLMNKEERMLAVQAMTRRGIFIVKGGVDRAALALGVSRHTIYNYLEELRQRDDSPRDPL